MLSLACTKDKIVHFDFFEENIDSDAHIKMMKKLISKIDSDQLNSTYIYIDNAPSHISYMSRDWCRASEVRFITSPTYHSEFNMAELIFRHIKNITYKHNFVNM